MVSQNYNLNKRPIGFSTGFLYHIYSYASKKVIKICRDMGCNAIGLHCPIEKFDLMEELNPEDLKDFEFITFHMSGEINKDKKTIEILNKIQEFHNKFKFDAITIHPGVVRDWNILKAYDLPISVENMDNYKKMGKSLESMKKIMSKNNYRMTLDINHSFANDSTPKLANDFWKEFKNRIDHFHLSGFKERKECHDPLYLTKQVEFIDFVKNKNKPIIIESVCKDLKEAKKEFDYIKKRLYS